MSQRGIKQYNLVKKLSFVRFGGTEGEERAASVITDEITAAGGSFELMPFTVPAYQVSECTVAAAAPFTKSIEAAAYGLSGNIDGEFKFFYASRGLEEDYCGVKDLENTVVMIDSLSYDAYKILCKKGAAAFITVSGKQWENSRNSDLVTRALRPAYLENGKIPGFMIWAKDAAEFVRRGVRTVRLKLTQREYEATSHNILSVIPGTADPEESVVLTAHYDSVLVGTGSWDNATGSANLVYLYKYFLQNPVRRTLRFIWCGSEEQGLLGSHAYVDTHPELVEQIKMCFNFDMCGTTLGSNNVFITGGDDLKIYAEQFCREKGWSAEFRVCVHSSDSAPFADKGIPSIGLSRGTKSAEIHTRNDLLASISAEELQNMGEFSSAFITRAADSINLPVKIGMPDDMKKELDKYFMRDKK